MVRIAFLLLVAGLFPASLAVADRQATEKTEGYIDLDGDGINDNDPDNNGNSIPDQFESEDVDPEGAVRSILGNVFNSDVAFKDEIDLRTNSDKFGSLIFRTRGLPQRCRALATENEFDSGSETGITSGAAGCVGGVCIR
jgi:hypothetical protein